MSKDLNRVATRQRTGVFRGAAVRPSSLLLLAVVLAFLLLSGCGGGSGAPAYGTPSAIQVILSQAPPSPVQLAAQVPIIATVLNDAAQMGVDWRVSCASSKCGTFSPAHTASGGATTFAAPASIPPSNSVNITAVSTADATKSVTVTVGITGPPVTIVFSAPLPPSSLQTGLSASLNATVSNDVQNLGVNWTLSCLGSGNTCGSLTLYHTASDSPTLYTAPVTAPPGGTVTITATAAAQTSQAVAASITITAPPIAVFFTQTPGPLAPGASGTVIAAVSNDPSNAGVDWSAACNGSSCGSFNPTHTASGAATTYKAPTAVPTGGLVTITATSTANKTESDSISVTISAPAGAIAVTITTPPPASLQTNAQAPVVAVVANDATNSGVDWSVTCGAGSTGCGSFSFTHTVSGGATTFTAPASVPSGNSVTITATAAADTTKTAASTVVITSPGRAGLLVGQYVFSMTGTDAKGFYAAAGSVIANGNGSITAGEEDFADTGGVHPTTTLRGTYSIGNDGRGIMTLTTEDTSIGVNGVQTLGLTVVSSQHAQVIEFDTSATSSGSLDLQTTSSLSQTFVTDGYSFAFSGVNLTKSSTPLALGGVLTADGKGNFTGVAEDVNDGGAVTAATHSGTYSALDSFGRGTASLGSASFAYYVVNSGFLRFVETDSGALTAGAAYAQGTTPISLSSLSGSFTFVAAGKSGSGALVVGGVLSADGKGSLTGATVDVNNAGTVSSGSPAGTYTMASNGRGTLTLTDGTIGAVSQFALYLTSSPGALLLELDSGLTSTGTLLAQSSGISADTLKGNYAAIFDAPAKAGEQDLTGEVISDGVSALSGYVNVNQSGGAPALNSAVTGSYTANSNGRFTGMLTVGTAATLTGAFYVADSSTVQFAETDTNGQATGLMQLQQFSAGPTVIIAFTGTPPPHTLQTSATASLTATVTNDTQNLGVNWTVSCQSTNCGSFSATHTASGASTTYTAPGTVPSGNIVTISATAGADPTQVATAVITITGAGSSGVGISIAFTGTPPPKSLQTGATASLTATVTNDTQNLGVNWTVSCASTACGSLSTTHTASGASVSYTAPGTVPLGSIVTVSAIAAAAPTRVATALITIGGGSSGAGISIAFTGTPPPMSLQTGATASLTATVTKDTQNLGVNWTVSCSSTSCGSFSATHTASGASTTYTAPGTVPLGNTVTISASAAAAPTQVAAALITITGASSSISISLAAQPPSSMIVGATTSLTADVSGDPSNAGVNWSATCASGSSSCGIFSPTHTASSVPTTYTAPAAEPGGNGQVIIVVTSTANPGVSIQALPITILPGPISVSINAPSQLLTNQPFDFTATVTNDPTQAGVTWSVTCPSGSASCGSFSSTGPNLSTTYTAPSSVPQGNGNVTVTATSVTDATKSASATFPIFNAGNVALLNGQYVFSVSGNDGGAYTGVGSVLLDGKGSVTGGEADFFDAIGLTDVQDTLSASGSSYTINPDGRGTMTLQWTSAGVRTLSFVVVNSSHAVVTEFDAAAASGSLDLQNTKDFTVKNSYAFLLSGVDITQVVAGGMGTPPLGLGGVMTADGNGNLTNVSEDVNDGGTVSSLTSSGTYTTSVDSNGRGTANLGSFNSQCTTNQGGATTSFIFYIIDSTRLRFLENDTCGTTVGSAFSLPAGVSAASLNGPYVFTLTGQTSSGAPVGAGGVFAANGSGTISSATVDVNNNGGLTSGGSPASSTYTVAPNGRGTLTFTGGNTGGLGLLALYFTSSQGVLVLELDSGLTTSGAALAQTSTTFSGGDYALSYYGAVTGGNQDVAAQVYSDGSANFTGNADVNQLYPLGSPSTVLSPNLVLTGTFTSVSNGRYTGTLNTTVTPNLNEVFYVENNSTVLSLDTDKLTATSGPATGLLQLQQIPLPLAVELTVPPTGALQTGAQAAGVIAVVTNDPANGGVDWSCAPAGSCGSFNPAHTSSGQATTYTAPSSQTSVTITAASHSAPSTTATATVQVFTQQSGVFAAVTGQPPSTLQTSHTAPVVAYVFNDTANEGVDWSATCGGLAGSICGSFNPSHTPSGGTTIYSAPPYVPPGNPFGSSAPVTLVAAPHVGGPAGNSQPVTIEGDLQYPTIAFSEGQAPPSTLQTSATAAIGATVQNDPYDQGGVDWSCAPAGSCGTFDPPHTNGGATTTYTAPATVPSGNSVTITAASTYYPTANVSQNVAITSAGDVSLLNGNYVFYVSGTDANGPYYALGAVALNGSGTVSGGEEDFVDLGPANAEVFTPISGGTYTIGSDGRGTLTITTEASEVGTQTFKLSVVSGSPTSGQHVLLTAFDSGATGSGSLDFQDASVANAPVSIVGKGSYSFLFSGADVNIPPDPIMFGGVLSADGSGNFTSGAEDMNDNGQITKGINLAGGTYNDNGGNLDAFGRGLATIGSNANGPMTYSYYVVDGKGQTVRFLENDFYYLTVGSAFAQPTSGVGQGSLSSGTYAFTAAGPTFRNFSASQPAVVAAGGLFTSNGNGNITGGTVDVNNNGTSTTGSALSNTSYSISTDGRGSFSFAGSPKGFSSFELYVTASNGVLLLETDKGSPPTGGVALLQSATTISGGTYAGNFDSLISLNDKAAEEDAVGQVTASGGAFTGTLDVNQFPPEGTGIQIAGAALTGSAGSGAAGRYTGGTLTLSLSSAETLSEIFYVVSNSTVLFLETDPIGTGTGPGTGILASQNLAAAPSAAFR